MSLEMLPVPPVFPGNLPRDALRPATRQRITTARLRQRASVTHAQPMTLTRYDVKAHGLDFLMYWWATAREQNEHVTLLGSVARTPTAFLQSYAGCDIMVLHTHDAWQEWQGVVAVVYSSDVIPGARYRLDYWLAPAYRHPTLSRQIARQVLDYLFQIRQFQLVWGLTPVTNTLAVRFLLRLGFQRREVWPGGTIDPHTGQPIDAVCTLIPRKAWEGDPHGA
jgi:RimJ/RimL family protein N-acetyltransferase